LADVILQEGAPRLRRRWAPANQVFGDGGLKFLRSAVG